MNFNLYEQRTQLYETRVQVEDDGRKCYTSFFFRLDHDYNKYSRQRDSLTDMLAYFGGLIKVTIFFGRALVSWFAEVSFYQFLIQAIYKGSRRQ